MIKEKVKDKKQYTIVAKGRLKPNKKSTHKLAPTFTGSILIDAEHLQKLIDKGHSMIMLPLSMWLKDSQFDDSQYVDIQTSKEITND